MSTLSVADSNLVSARSNLLVYKEILAASEEIRSVWEKDDGSGRRLWELLNLIRVDVDRILKASEAFIQVQRRGE